MGGEGLENSVISSDCVRYVLGLYCHLLATSGTAWLREGERVSVSERDIEYIQSIYIFSLSIYIYIYIYIYI